MPLIGSEEEVIMISVHFMCAFALALAACGCGDAANGKPGEPGSTVKPPENSIKVSKLMIVTNTPLTVDVELPERFRAALKVALASDAESVRLMLRDVQTPTDVSVTGYAVFADKTDANAKTSADDPHHVGAFAFYPRSPASDAKLKLHQHDLKVALVKIKFDALTAKTIPITIIPLSEEGTLATTAKFTIGELEIAITDTKK
jgi:hypothetical protein